MPFQPGNKLAVRGKPFRDALRVEIAAAGDDQKVLREVARKLLDLAKSGDMPAIKELADRTDGKVPQAHEHGGTGGGPIQTVDLTNATSEQLAALEAIFGPLAAASGDDGSDPEGEGTPTA